MENWQTRNSPFRVYFPASTLNFLGSGVTNCESILLGLQQGGGIVREILKIGMDQHPGGHYQLMGYVGQHGSPF